MLLGVCHEVSAGVELPVSAVLEESAVNSCCPQMDLYSTAKFCQHCGSKRESERIEEALVPFKPPFHTSQATPHTCPEPWRRSVQLGSGMVEVPSKFTLKTETDEWPCYFPKGESVVRVLLGLGAEKAKWAVLHEGELLHKLVDAGVQLGDREVTLFGGVPDMTIDGSTWD